MRIVPEIDQASLVLLGRFNPAIFQPLWFARNDIIGAKEAEAAEIEIIHPEICKFQTENYVIQVERQRFLARSRSVPIDLVKDLVIKTFGDYLSHTPAGVLGINRMVHFDTGSFGIRDAVGRELAPWGPWGDWAQSLEGRDLQTHGGMIALHMQQNVAPEGYKGYVRVIVQPSPLIPNSSGIYMDINNHYEIVALDEVVGCGDVLAALEDQWQSAMRRAGFIIDQIMKRVEEIKNASAGTKA